MHEIDELGEQRVGCPYCGEPLDILVDPGDAGFEYTEDCQVCCQPILMLLDPHSGIVVVRREDETSF